MLKEMGEQKQKCEIPLVLRTTDSSTSPPTFYTTWYGEGCLPRERKQNKWRHFSGKDHRFRCLRSGKNSKTDKSAKKTWARWTDNPSWHLDLCAEEVQITLTIGHLIRVTWWCTEKPISTPKQWHLMLVCLVTQGSRDPKPRRRLRYLRYLGRYRRSCRGPPARIISEVEWGPECPRNAPYRESISQALREWLVVRWCPMDEW